MARYRLAVCFIAISLMIGCKNPFQNPFSNPFGGSEGRESVQPDRIIEPTDKFQLAVGGVASGRDELVLYDEYGNERNFVGDPLVCSAADEDLVELEPRPECETFSECSGVRIVAKLPGVTAITCVIGDIELDDVYEVTIPPQPFIQILIAEAGWQIMDEATLDPDLGEDVVALSSSSPTANALGSVIRNRIELINQDGDPSLFGADDDAYDLDPPASYYDAVIFAENQFSPTDPNDLTYDTFLDAESRSLLYGDWLIAYDQAVISAAGVFNGDIEDTTGGSFAFRSPTPDEWETITNAWNSGAEEIPDGAGFTDSSFPALAPIQLLIHPDVWTYGDGRPAFIFARSRNNGDAPITNVP